MAGHNKWSTIRHRKGRQDAQRAKLFTKLIRELTTAARLGGGDPDANPRLRKALDEARAHNMPKAKYERAIAKGTGTLDGGGFEHITYEGYGLGGAAILVECTTDNTNRTVSEVRHAFSKHGGELGKPGCVAYLFSPQGRVVLESAEGEPALAHDDLLMAVLASGADDFETGETDREVIITCQPSIVDVVRSALEDAGLPVQTSQVAQVPAATVELSGEDARAHIRIIELLEDNDDVDQVWSNFDLDDATAAALQAEDD